jgi:predicted amino acid dehydrogenase
MKTAVGVSLGSGEHNFDFETDFLGERLKVWRVGTDASKTKTVRMLQSWERTANAIGIAVSKEKVTLPSRRAIDEDVAGLTSVVTRVPVTTGARLADILQEWAIRHVQNTLGSFFTNTNVLFFSGMSNLKLAQTMSEYTQNVSFADPILQLGIPKLLTSLDQLRLYSSGAHWILDGHLPAVMTSDPMKEWNRFFLKKAIHGATVVVAPVHDLEDFGKEDLEGKTVVTSTVSDERLARLGAKGVAMVVDGSPFLFGHVIAPSLLDAMIIAAAGKRPGELREDDYLEILTRLDAEPRILYPNGFKRVNRFAFVIHPLSQEYFKTVKPIEVLSQVSPPIFMDAVEKALAYLPPFVYSKVTGIRSPTGVEAEGWLISVGGTPKEIMSHDPEFTYRRLLDAAKIARQLGAQIMGLGAFTKVVGDAGATVARRAPLPITTGNSYSASGALWAARDALLRLRLLPPPKPDGKIAMKAMVVGATGAIGSVCTRLLAMAAEEVYMVSPETAKLLSLKESILKDTPDARLFLSSRADKDVADMDMIVTATSGAGKKILDIMKVKPGCVITDVARPLDLPPEEVARRPDVLVVESGEIQLPGDVTMRNIGLPANVAYACLAETIVLALEGRFESYTVGREIEWAKVREIYRLGLKHGMKLAAISGVNGPFSDADIAKVRELALAARARDAAPRLSAKAPGAKPVPRRPATKAASPARRPARAPSRKRSGPAPRPGRRTKRTPA